jgi:uncharacterized membrane protein
MKKISLFLMVALYVAAGANHFLNPEAYIKIMPPWIPLHKEMVFVSGVCEILFALLLIFQLTRRMAAWCIIALLVAVFPANVQMMLNYYHEHNPGLWFTVLRLPLQVPLIWWAYIFTKPQAVKIS